jgi:small subunit ribosomal protein S20
MPITKSGKKALRQNIKRRAENKTRKRNLKILIKDARANAAQSDRDKKEAVLPSIYKALDKAAKSGLIKKNSASRKKSRLAKLLAQKSA